MATTRPETILGDTAVAVHPEDERYKDMIGKTVIVPILDREIPVIADDYVDREFGTGALKITPGHDINDYAIGERHSLEIISILNKDASINQHGGPYAGQDRVECREKLWADMKAAGLVIKEQDYHPQDPPLAARRRDHRTDDIHPVVRHDRLDGQSRTGSRPGRAHPDRAGLLHQGVLQLDGKHPGLVHLAPVVVGAPYPGLVRPRWRDVLHPQ